MNYTEYAEKVKSMIEGMDDIRCRNFLRDTLNRRTGDTTRSVDKLIQSIFAGKIVSTRDKHRVDKHLFDLVVRRLTSEHGIHNFSIINRHDTQFSISYCEIQWKHYEAYSSLRKAMKRKLKEIEARINVSKQQDNE